jgi:hypothetical protein
LPFTGSHPDAVLPFLRTTLPTTALVAGSMAPDVPVFLHGGPHYVQTHTLIGVLTVDALLGGLMLLIWHLLLAAPARAVAPAALRARLPHRKRGVPDFAVGYVALVVGGLTHIGWDEFTHRDRAAVRHIGWLHHEHTLGGFTLPGYSWAQYGSTVAGLLILAIWAARWYRRTRPSSGPAPGLSLPVRVAATGLVAAAGLVGAFVGGREVGTGGSPSRLAVSTITRGGDALVLMVVVLAVGWHLRPRQLRRPPA